MGFYYLAAHQEQGQGREGAAGRIIMPSGVQSIAIDRRHSQRRTGRLDFLAAGALESADSPSFLLDPQLYLAELPGNACSKKCSNLVGYPWFRGQAVPEFDSGRLTQNEYREGLQDQIAALWQGRVPNTPSEIEAAVGSAVAFQVDIGCDGLILPSPLTVDPSSNYEDEMRWLDRGLKAAAEFPYLPAYATVALSDICTFTVPVERNALIAVIVDHVTAREPAGVYIVFEQRIDDGYYVLSDHTFRTLLELVHEFRAAGLNRIIVSWMGTSGLPAIAAGASGWAAGWYRSERRLKMNDFRDDSGGLAAPAFYCHALAGDVHPNDVDRIREAGHLDLIADRSPWGDVFMRAVGDGKLAKTVDVWNQQSARAHFNVVAIRETERLLALPAANRPAHITKWLEEAGRRAEFLREAIGPDLHPRTSLRHQRVWAKAFSAWANPTDDDSRRTHSGD